jgi:hypothetical protein
VNFQKLLLAVEPVALAVAQVLLHLLNRINRFA